MLTLRHSGVLLFGITPPGRSAGPERVREIAEIALGRLRGLDLDGLILYDIDDESDRTPDERPAGPRLLVLHLPGDLRPGRDGELLTDYATACRDRGGTPPIRSPTRTPNASRSPVT